MQWIKHKVNRTLALIVFLAAFTWAGEQLVANRHVLAATPPQLPHTLYGTVTVDGVPAVDGTQLQVLITHSATETVSASTTTFSSGGQPGYYSVALSADDSNTSAYDGGRAGDTITFSVSGVNAVQSASFSSGATQALNLTIPNPTATPTDTPVPPTNTPTYTPVPPTATLTNTPVLPTNTPSNTPISPTATNTPVPPTTTPSDTPISSTATNTPVPPTTTPSDTPISPTATNTPVPPTNTPSDTPISSTATNTPVPPTNTPSDTPISSTATNTPVPPTTTPSDTPISPTATNTPVPPTATPTSVATTSDVAIAGLSVTDDGPTDIGLVTNFAATIVTGTNVLYQWNFGDGATALGAATSHLYLNPGNYTAIVTATNTANTVVATTTVSILTLGGNACTQQDLKNAIASGGTGTVNLDGNCIYQVTEKTGTLSSGELLGVPIQDAAVIEGNGAIIESAPGAPDMHLLYVAKSGIVIRNLTVRGAHAIGNGGGMYIGAAATLSNVTVISNTATNVGGGLVAYAPLTVINSTFKNNQSTTKQLGGAIFFQGGTLSVERSTFIGNKANTQGGAIYGAGAGTTFITNSLFSGNVSNLGAAFFGGTNHVVTLVHSTIADATQNPSNAIITSAPLTAKNNIFFNYDTAFYGNGSTVFQDYNLFANVPNITRNYAAASVTNGINSKTVVDAKFVDPANGNYRLQSTSPAIDAGANLGVNNDADNKTRPYLSTQPDMGAYEYQGGSSPSLAITKNTQPFPWLTANTPMIYVVRVTNQSLVTATNLVVNDTLPTGATYKPNSASDGGIFNNGKLTWNLASLGVNQSKEFTYVVTPTQQLVSTLYVVSSTTNSAVIAYGATITTPVKNIVASLNVSGSYFVPNVDGFGYPNYGETITGTNGISDDLSIVGMVKLFGNVVCKTQNPCVLTAAAEAWRQATMEMMTKGHCFGFAMLALDIFARAPVPSDFQAGIFQTFGLKKEPLRQAIGLYWSLQLTDPSNVTGLQYSPPVTTAVGVLDFLSTNFSSTSVNSDRYTLSIRRIDGSGGHAVTPYAIEQVSSSLAYIYVYDNNYPNDFTRVVKVNRTNNSWEYGDAQINPSAPASTYTGTASSKTIGLRSLNYHVAYPKNASVVTPAPTSTLSRMLTPGSTSNTMRFAVSGEAYLLITRDDGLRVGQDPTTGAFINEIPDTEFISLDTGSGLNIPPMVQLEHVAGKTYKIQLFNRRSALGGDASTVSLSISGAGYGVGMNGLVLDSPLLLADSTTPDAQYDGVTLSFSPETKRLSFQTSKLDGQMPQLVMAVSQGNGADYTLNLNNVNLDKGESVAIAIDTATGQLTLENNSGQSNKYNLEVTRINTNGTTNVFSNSTITDGTGVGAVIDVGSSWNGASTPTITTNNTTTLPPANQMYLPMVVR